MAFRALLRRCISLCMAVFLATPLFAQSKTDVHFASDPAISPDGQTVVFEYENDLWQVPTEGGRAVRLTGMDGRESDPSISPDGKWLAFSSDQYGNNDIYIMPLDGGKITRLTYHQASDQVDSWDWNSKTIYFRSNRYNRISTYSISVDGGTPKRLFGNYQNTVHSVVKHPKRDEFFFNESWESFLFPQRKRYRGPFNPDIKSYNTKTGEFKKYTDWEGKDFWPMLDRDGNLYFVSDRANKEYNLYTIQKGNKKQLTNFDTSVRYPAISADGSTIVFEKEYQLFTYDVASGKSRQIPISIYQNNTLTKNQSFDTRRNISDFDVSPDKKKLAFISRGELFISDMEGKFVHELDTDEMGRVKQVKWLSDNKRVIFNQTVDGYQNWFVIAADGSDKATQLTNEHDNNRMLALNSDRSKGVYLSGRDELMLIDLKTLKEKRIVKDEFWGYENQQPRFAPDDKHILYSAKRDFESDIFSYDLETGKSINLTMTGVSETGAFWSPDGKYIYFASSRTRPSYPRGSGQTDLYRMALKPMDQPYRSTRFEKLFEEKKSKEKDEKDKDEDKKEKSSEKPEITIQEKGLMQRLEQIGPHFGTQRSPYVLQNDDKTTVLYLSDHDRGKTALWKTTMSPFGETKTKKIDGTSYMYDITDVDGDVFGLSRGQIYKINVGAGKAEPIKIEHHFQRNLRAEFNQMFEELWANIQENYYNSKLNGIDWKTIRKRYHSYLPYVNSRDDFRQMMNDMLGELNSSHMGFYTSGPESQEYYKTVTQATGILYKKDHPYEVAKIIPKSPADIVDTDIRPGDQLVAVNGQQINPQKNRESYFAKPDMEDELALTFKRGDESFSAKVHPTSYSSIRTDLYDVWEQNNQDIVDKETDKRVAYVHMKDMTGQALQDFLVEMTSETYHRDALILDLRYNTGGNVHNKVLQFLSQRPYLKWKYRDGDFAPQPNFAPDAKPIVLLVNEQTLSDGEVTAAGFKQLGLGTIVGTETYRWIIFTSGKGLVDGSFYRLPSWGVYTLDGKNLEHLGINPDIPVDNTFKDRLDKQDPQLQKAVDVVMDKLNSK